MRAVRQGQPGRWLLLVLVAVFGGILLPGAATAGTEGTQAAGFIVDTGTGEPVYVIATFAEPESAIGLLRRADLGLVTVDFGGLGAAVCEIRATGCDVDACRKRLCQTGDPDSPFWQYWVQDDEGWKLSPLGGSAVTPGNGDIAAWVWIGTTPALESLGWQTVAERAGAPPEVVAGSISGAPAVYVSARDDASDGVSSGAVFAATGVVAVVVLASGGLVLRQRRAGSPA